jgi:hypothetical protein
MTFWAIALAIVLGGILLYLMPVIVVFLAMLGAIMLRIIFSRIGVVLLAAYGLFWILAYLMNL